VHEMVFTFYRVGAVHKLETDGHKSKAFAPVVYVGRKWTHLTLVFPLRGRAQAGCLVATPPPSFTCLRTLPRDLDNGTRKIHYDISTERGLRRQRSVTGREKARSFDPVPELRGQRLRGTRSLGLIGLIPTREIGLDDGMRQVGRSPY